MSYSPPKRNTYGALTELSKELNNAFGDTSGRTVSHRTAHGFKKFFNSRSLHDNDAEHIIHAGMVTAGALLKSPIPTHKATGVVLTLGLMCCYQEGKKRPYWKKGRKYKKSSW